MKPEKDNPYESPNANADKARYDRTLFWRVVKASMALLAIFIILDMLFWAQHQLHPANQGIDGITSFFTGDNADWLREQFHRVETLGGD